MTEDTTTEEQLREAAVKRIKKRRDFYGHVVAYVIVNAFLVLVWYFTSGSYFWPMWVMIGWGVGLAFNAWDVFGRRKVTSEADIRAEMDRMRGSGRGGS